MIAQNYYPVPRLKMPTRKPFIVVGFFVVSLLLLLSASRRLGSWAPSEAYHRPDPHKSQQAPQQQLQQQEANCNCDDGRPGAKHTDAQPPVRPAVDPLCEGFPDTSKVLLVMDTGATEAYAKVPTQMMTVLKCVPEYLIFSDLEQNIAGHEVHDSLATVLFEAQDGNPDFDLYRRQKACVVDQATCNKVGKPSKEGWNLDKYKKIHITEKAYAMRPNYDWYLFTDADTYVLWPNLMQWLKQLDPTKKLYLGSVAMMGGFPFGHGGSGYIVSKAAMEDFVGKHPGVGNEYDVRAKTEAYGDYLFAVAIKEKADVPVQQVWPTINGEKPATLPFGPSHWCHPIVTMHHMNSEEVNTFWHFERKKTRALSQSGSSRPLVIRDIFEEYLEPNLNATREDWDNNADNRYYLDPDPARKWENHQLDRVKNKDDYNEYEKKAHESFEACGAACKSVGKECFQYRYRDGACSFGDSFQLGHPVKREQDDKKRMMSGWDIEKIRSWIQEQAPCKDIKWPKVETKD